jgi:hypothetical protein
MEELEKKTIFTCKTITFTCEGKNMNKLLLPVKERTYTIQCLLPVKGRT